MDQITQIPDVQLDAYAGRLKDVVVLITGGGNGIGRETAVLCAKHGAKIVIGDLDVSGMEVAKKLIEDCGRECLTMHCDVTSWKDQTKLFSAALDKFGTINVVVANAGVAERFGLGKLKFDSAGKPERPDILTTEVNVVGVMYTTHLAVHYLRETHTEGSLKSLIYLASMAGIVTLGGAPQYTASKHAVLGLMRALSWPNAKFGVKIAAVTPWFVDTGILPDATKALLSGLTYVPLQRAAGAILYAATEPDAEMTGGCIYAMMDGVTSLTRFPRDSTVSGVFAELNARLDAVFGLQAMHKWAPRMMRTVGACVLLVVAMRFTWARLL